MSPSSPELSFLCLTERHYVASCALGAARVAHYWVSPPPATAIVTQIEKPDQNYVRISNSLFCFNEAEISPHIFNFRDNTHECDNCKFNTRDCCSGNGEGISGSAGQAIRVVAAAWVSGSRSCMCSVP